MRDVYLHPTIRSLAAYLGDAVPAAESPGVETPAVKRAAPAARPAAPPSASPVLCGALQLMLFLGFVYLGALVFVWGFEWIRAGAGVIDTYLRSFTFASASFPVTCTVPILAK